MWYVIQTITGKEDELIAMMRVILDPALYRDCFVMRAEWMKRLGGVWQVQIRPLFPGYVIVDTERPEELFLALKGVPRFSRLLGNGRFAFTALEAEERAFLRILAESGGTCPHLARRSLVETSPDGAILCVHDLLARLRPQIERINLHKRYAIVRVPFLHEERTAILGIRLKKDT